MTGNSPPNNASNSGINISFGDKIGFLDISPVPALITNLEGIILHANPQFSREFGYHQDEIKGSQAAKLYTNPADRRKLLALLEKNKQVQNYELLGKHADGSSKFVLLSIHPFVLDGISLLFSTMVDISNHKTVEDSLQESEERFRTVADFTFGWETWLDIKGQYEYISPACERISGYKPSEFADHPELFAEIVLKDDKELVETHLHEHQSTADTSPIQFRIIRKTGELRWINHVCQAVYDANGNFRGRRGSNLDITEQKLLEKEIRDSLAKRGEQVSLTTQIAQEIATAPSLERIFELVVTLIKERFNYYHTQIFRYDPNTEALKLIVGFGETGEAMLKAGHQLPMGRGVVGSAASTGKTVLASDTATDRDWRPNPFLPDTRGELAVPIKFQDEILGILDVQSDQPGALTQDDTLLLENLAGQIAIAIENTRLRDEMSERIEEMESLYKSIAKSGADTAKKDSRIAWTYRADKGEVVEEADDWILDLEQLLQERSTITVPAKDDPDKRIMISPLDMRGEIVGALGIEPEDFRNLGTEDLEMLEAISDQVTQALESARLFQQTQQSEEHLRALIDNAPEAIILIDTKTGVFIDPNENAIRLYGLPANELTKVGLIEMSPEFQPDDRLSSEAMSEYIQRALAGEVQVFEWTHKNANQQLIPCEIRLARLPGIQNQVRATVTDITERKIAQEELAKFKLGIEQTEGAIFITDINGTIQYANPGFEKVYGFTVDEAIGQTPRIIKSGIIPQEQYESFWKTLLSKNTITGEITNKTKDGRLIPIAATNSPILDEKGEILGFLAVHNDITERKQAEEAIRRRNEYLAATAEIGRLVTSTLDLETLFSRTVNLVVDQFDYYHASIFITDETGTVAQLREATGSTGERMKQEGQSIAVGAKSIVGQATKIGSPVVANDVKHDPLYRSNPLLPESQAEAAIPLRASNKIIGVLNIHSRNLNAFTQDDVSILQTLADQVAVGIENASSYELAQQAVEELREVDRIKSQFLANMSHELRTPLNSIIGFSRVILKGIDGPISELQQQDLTAIYNSGQHLLGLINDILDLSKIEAGKMELSFDDINLADTVKSVMSTAIGLVKDKPVELKQDVEPDLPLVRADAMRVRQVLLNLISNAAKFTEEGSITVKATRQLSPDGLPEIIVRVIDTGPGISQEDQTKLFQPFSQVDDSPTRKTGGTGLGLSISNAFVHMHGGRIGVESKVGAGSIFYFTLPLQKSQQSADDGSHVILAIDDDPTNIELYDRYLKNHGYQVIAITEPAKAVEKAVEIKPFAITLDIMMPEIDGWQVLSELKANPTTRDIPVIICSILDEENKGFNLGATDYLVKPIMEDDLLHAINRINPDGSIREVLVIDDSADDLRMISKMLTNGGLFKAVLAQGGKAGWEILSKNTPQAIILDLFMPDMNGFTILEKLQAEPELRNVPVIIVSGAELNAEQKQQLADYGNRMIEKGSLSEEELLTSIEKALKQLSS